MNALTLVRAQVDAEVKSRLRSSGTVFAVLALFAAAFLWIPDPATHMVSIAWQSEPGTTVSGLYDSRYVGASAAILAAFFLSLIGFYLVAGSVRRDRERGVGAILAATPLGKASYLAGKLAAHTAYLVVMGGVALAAGVVAFVRFGTGPLAPADYLWPFALLVVPGMVFVAALAVLFDVTPGLSGRGGPVLYFFVWTFVLFAVPVQLHGGIGRKTHVRGVALYDPIGAATIVQLVEQSMPGIRPGAVSIGVERLDSRPTRVPWPGLPWSPAHVIARAGNLLWAAVPFAFAVLVFDRFDPARRRNPRVRRLTARTNEPRPVPTSPDVRIAGAAVAGLGFGRLPGGPPALDPSPRRAILAEARLVFATAGPLRWALVPAALVAALPAEAGIVGTAVLLLLLAPLLSEAAARETIHGAAALVLTQPAVPRRPVLWKAGAAGVVLTALGLPRLLSASIWAPERAFAFLLGLVFVAAAATAAAALTGGGKLFSGAYVALWYVAINGAAGFDFSGAFAPPPLVPASAAFAGAGGALLLLAAIVEARRR